MDFFYRLLEASSNVRGFFDRPVGMPFVNHNSALNSAFRRSVSPVDIADSFFSTYFIDEFNIVNAVWSFV